MPHVAPHLLVSLPTARSHSPSALPHQHDTCPSSSLRPRPSFSASTADLLRHGYPSLSLHGGKEQVDRDATIADFKSGVAPLLIATSVAGRGLDVKECVLVVNYSCPNHLEDYVHR